ncbi:MAG TPA: permease [Candidatus Kapabacteria bacterium]|jgi:hypothetical protein
MLNKIGDSFAMAFTMFWEIFWALALGFFISAIVQALVSRKKVVALLPDDSARTLAIACALGSASSSCSYASVAIARSLFRKGANFTASIAFEFASTNIIFDLGIVIFLLLGWHFVLAELLGSILMIIVLALLFRLFLKRRMVERARTEAEKGVKGIMEGHAAMDMSVKAEGSLVSKIVSPNGWTAISHYFVMDWVSVWRDIALGLVIAGFLAVWVDNSFWKSFFYSGHGTASSVWGAFIGPVVSMLSFVCSVGNVPLAAVLWNGGISFGGVISFIFADLIILPILNIYRKYYGMKMMLFLLVTSYVAMAIGGLAIEGVFSLLGIIPTTRHALITSEAIGWNYTTFLDIAFLLLAALLLIRFFRTHGMHMLKMMK